MLMRIFATLLTALAATLTASATHRHWTTTHGLPTGEVQQIVELPQGQMLVNCEGVFCISNGATFDVVACDYSRACQLGHYVNSYGQQWQGDSLLWLHDFYRVFVFDARRRCFRYDTDRQQAERFAATATPAPGLTASQQLIVDSLGLTRRLSVAVADRQGGLWIGTRNDGITYVPPRRDKAGRLSGSDPLIGIARSHTDRQGRVWHCKAEGLQCDERGTLTLYNTRNVEGLPYNRTTFVRQIADGRYLLCDSLSTLGYFTVADRRFTPLNSRIKALDAYRHFVGACPVDDRWTVVYAQNGAFRLDTKADTLAPFAANDVVARYTTKYNCMLRDDDGQLWVGTQNGLFRVGTDGSVERIGGLANNCIRSLVADRHGRLWAGTSCGIARVTPTVVNLGVEDGVPPVPMMERAACLVNDGRLVFAMGGVEAVVFNPDALVATAEPMAVVITACRANGQPRCTDGSPLTLSHTENQLTLEFSTLDYAAPSHTAYRYRLLPIEQNWNTSSDGSGRAAANYTALPPGSYTFEAQAANAEGQWGDTTTLRLTITPPAWLTWWAKTLYALVAVAALVALIALYLKRRRQKLERENDERVNRLFELRDEARHQFAQTVSIDPHKIAADKDEEAIVERMLKAIGQNMDNLDYTVDQLARDVGMSRASLYKKTQQMLGLTPNDFLRSVRLKEAARLLTDTQQPVSQVSLMVGFQTARYFSQCFKQMFGMTPSEYRSAAATDHSTTEQ